MDASEISNWMVRRLATELGISEVEVKTDIPLLSLGVDSLKLLSIAGELSEFTNREVSADVIWDNDSIECLASHLAKMGEDQTAIQQENLISSEALPPLVVIVGGLKFGQRVAGFVPSNAITAWRKLDFLYSDPEVPSVALIADSIVESLDNPEQHRMVAVVGYSLSGLICMEIAKRLSETCHDVRLTMVEPPVVWKSSQAGASDGRKAGRLKRLRNRQGYFQEIIHLKKALQRFSVRCFQELALRPYAKCILAVGGDLPEVTRKWWYFRRKVKSRVLEHPFETYAGGTLLIARDKWLTDYGFGWSEVLTGDTLTFSVSDSNSHRLLEEEEGIQSWGPAFKKYVGDTFSDFAQDDFGDLKIHNKANQAVARAA